MIRHSEFDISVNGRTLPCLLAEPGRDTATADPALFVYLGGPRKKAIEEAPNVYSVERFVQAGYRAVSIDLPFHGDRADTQRPTGLAGMCAAVMAGEDPFDMFVEDGMACIDQCIRRRLHEFDPGGDDPWVAALALQHCAHMLAGRPVYLVIGNRDNRVGTECCTRFALSLFETELRLGRETSAVHLDIDSQAVGHRVSDGWRRRADQFLLNRARGDALPNTDRFTAQIEAQP